VVFSSFQITNLIFLCKKAKENSVLLLAAKQKSMTSAMLIYKKKGC